MEVLGLIGQVSGPGIMFINKFVRNWHFYNTKSYHSWTECIFLFIRLCLCSSVKFYICHKDLKCFFYFYTTLVFMLLFSIRFLNWLFWRWKKAIDFCVDYVCVHLPKFLIFLLISSDLLLFMNYETLSIPLLYLYFYISVSSCNTQIKYLGVGY